MKNKLPLHLAFPAALVLCLLYMSWFKKHNSPLTSGDIVSFEIAGTPEKAQGILTEWARLDLTDKFLSSIYWDYPFILLYALSLSLGCLWAAGLAGYPVFKRVAPWLAGGVWLAGLSDVAENLAMTFSVRQGPQTWSTRMAEMAAYFKFGLLAIGLLFVVVALLAALIRVIRR